MIPLDVFYGVMYEAIHCEGIRVPYAFVDEDGIFSVAHFETDDAALSMDAEERIRSMISDLEDSRHMLEIAKKNS